MILSQVCGKGVSLIDVKMLISHYVLMCNIYQRGWWRTLIFHCLLYWNDKKEMLKSMFYFV